MVRAGLLALVTSFVSSLSFAAVVCEQPQLGTMAISTQGAECNIQLIQPGQAWKSVTCSQVWDGEKTTIYAKLQGDLVPFQPTLKIFRTTSLNVTYAAIFADGAAPVSFQGDFNCHYE